jgi:chorismate mutase
MNENRKTYVAVIMRSNQPKRSARHAWLALLGQLFMLAGGIVLATGPATASAARQDAALDALLNLMRERLLLMHEVAKWKWNAAKPINDAGRERELLAALERKGAAYGLRPKQVRAFLAAQIKAAKLIQEADFNAWKESGQGKFSDARDLTTDLRPELDKLSDQMLGQLAKVAPLLGDEETKTNVARRAKSALRGDGINDEVRTVAIRPLLADSAEADRAAPPPTAKRPVADVYHGIEVRDDYRWQSGCFLFQELDVPYQPVTRATP